MDLVQGQQTQAMSLLTEADARVLLADVLALLVGEEHVGRETPLGSVGVCETVSMELQDA